MSHFSISECRHSHSCWAERSSTELPVYPKQIHFSQNKTLLQIPELSSWLLYDILTHIIPRLSWALELFCQPSSVQAYRRHRARRETRCALGALISSVRAWRRGDINTESGSPQQCHLERSQWEGLLGDSARALGRWNMNIFAPSKVTISMTYSTGLYY